MKLFQKTGEKIETLWREKNYAEDEFPGIAESVLQKAGLPDKISAWEVLDWTLKQTHLPEQRDINAGFGDPPITLYNAPRFYIDVYFWLEGTTAIHQHSFCGAFQVLHGSSIHSWYEFEKHAAVNTFLETGRMSLKSVELLEVGDVQKILAGRQYIHGLFHLEQPSATIVVRTYKSPLHLPQYSYHKPFLAVDPFFEEANTTKKLQCITTLLRTDYPDTDRLIAELLADSDFQTCYAILSTIRNHLRQNQIDRMFNLSRPEERFEKFLGIVREKHGRAAEVLPEIFAHREMTEEILRRRSYISDPEQRFFLALLMNVEGKERILPLVKSRFPDRDPVEKILDWTLDLAETRVLGQNIPNALGIADFADLDLFLLECLLKDMSDEEIGRAFKREYPDENFAEIAPRIEQKTRQIRHSAIFRPLLAGPPSVRSETSSPR